MKPGSTGSASTPNGDIRRVYIAGGAGGRGGRMVRNSGPAPKVSATDEA